MKRALICTSLAAIVAIVSMGFRKTNEGWTTDCNAALAQAKAEHKMALLDFTGSDWCPWCMRLDREVFAQPEFKQFAAGHLVLVDLDFPRLTPQPADLQRRNEQLREKYGVRAFPTVIVLDGDGRKIGELGYEPGGPGVFLADLAKLGKE